MGSPEGVTVTDAADSMFPAVDIDKELNPAHNNHVEVDPVSSELSDSLEIKEKARRKAVERKREEVKTMDEALQMLKSAFVISGVIAAVAVAAFAIAKQFKQN